MPHEVSEYTVHPRGRGERGDHVASAISNAGSSPRARGTVGAYACHPVLLTGSSPRARGTGRPARSSRSAARFIPAGAGNGTDRHNPVTRLGGSSPRARGTVTSRTTGSLTSDRFIPAGAGNGCRGRSACRRAAGSSPRARGTADVSRKSTVHPRGRGERQCSRSASRFIPAGAGNGSVTMPRWTSATRFIPAGAGNGHRHVRSLRSRAVHPRGRGERHS